MRFRKYRGMQLTYEQQGMIFFTCRNYARLPREQQKKIIRLCQQAGRNNPYALFLLLTTNRSVQSLMAQFKLASETTLYEARNTFYRLWHEEEQYEKQ